MEMTKTTLNLPAELLHQTKMLALQNKMTLTELVTRALEKVVANQKLSRSTKPSLDEFLASIKPSSVVSEDKRQETYTSHLMEKYGARIPRR